ncbi:MAG: hypothetical protein AW11_03682 [Candidatus Accumulibacter regalis]|uniref:DUF3616 domain-containing protein n=1 Tax=Accumulibacter regalis TaxID=522306 RepID=A0A011NQU8_ACCRE|nr:MULTISPECIES: DUF3616 domain-containing protein [unclassified Candidatus Accumulibacter]EXI85123.1 MAG: hypothetical protein AW11_03682 [Candidatus Accumulibacter regalis]MBL8368915.1 DUF3616 domain-containing protein [Accumulibacter sp.]MBN8515541.1 DUF3616 domain-containing protein [Accumulibacter sp.]MBO3702387.1 DUF3616 domain-containing protein [Accumulibacter sp.]HRE71646.1 DUF3616 domain-containing protein [Accumulibacter sp.]
MTPNTPPSFRTLTGVYEPSGIQQLPDGRFVVVEDDSRQALSVIDIGADGRVSVAPLATHDAQREVSVFDQIRDALGLLGDDPERDEIGELDDLEGVAVDRAGVVYAITSHSRDNDGKVYPAREKLIRFRIDGTSVVDAGVATGVKGALTAAHPALAAAAEIRDVKADGGLNIEGLTMSPDQRALLIGFRAPLLGGRAIIAYLQDPETLFDQGAEPRIAARLSTLDLAGNGIRGMTYVPLLKGYLVIAGPIARAQVQFELWFWSGDDQDPARRVSVAGLPGFEHAEGISAAVIDGQPRIVIVSDDGNRKQERFARFLLLDPAQLQIAP